MSYVNRRCTNRCSVVARPAISKQQPFRCRMTMTAMFSLHCTFNSIVFVITFTLFRCYSLQWNFPPSQFETNTDNSRYKNDFYVRQAIVGDLGPVSNILTYGFFSQGTTFFTYQVERLKTYLSLESMFSHQQNLAKRDQQSIIMMVACRTYNGDVVGVCEVDNRLPQEKKQMLEYRPYMCNLAVDKNWRRRGIAKALVESCEEVALLRWGAQKLYLKVREENIPAQILYKSLGYSVVSKSYQDDCTEEHEQSVKEYLGDGSVALVFYKNLDSFQETSSYVE